MALSSEPPRPRPFSRIISTSCVKPKVRAREISRTKETSAKSTSTVECSGSNTGCANSMEKLTLKPLNGSRRTFLSPCSISSGCRMRTKRLRAACSSMPADCSRNTNVPALPSMIGTSSAETSTNALSMPSPKKADIRCSTVETRAPSCSSTVAMTVLLTLSARAGMAGLPGRSERQKTMPVSMGAGRSAIATLRPVCRPTPVARTVVFRVRWRIMRS